MENLSLQKFAPAITVDNVGEINKSIDSSLQKEDSLSIDFAGIMAIQMDAARELLKPLFERYGSMYRRNVHFVNVTQMVDTAFVYSGY